jgi:hypothetical protein
MLTVLPIQDKNVQKELCELCGASFDAYSFAYRADDGEFLGVCQFKFVSGVGEISAFNYAPNTSDDEAMIIMLRTAMNFMHRCGLKKSVFLKDSAPEALLNISSYGKNEGGIYEIDLDKFYISPCHYNK